VAGQPAATLRRSAHRAPAAHSPNWAIGTWDGTTCTVVTSNEASKVGTAVSGSANITADTTVSYTVEVGHY
jgi:hypothetical protein